MVSEASAFLYLKSPKVRVADDTPGTRDLADCPPSELGNFLLSGEV